MSSTLENLYEISVMGGVPSNGSCIINDTLSFVRPITEGLDGADNGSIKTITIINNNNNNNNNNKHSSIIQYIRICLQYVCLRLLTRVVPDCLGY